MIIETDRLLLRPFAETDAADIFEYLHTPEVNCFACMRLEKMEDARKDAAEKTGDPDLYLAITVKETGKVIGEIFAHPEGTDPESEVKDTWSPCWMLNPAYQGKGYMASVGSWGIGEGASYDLTYGEDFEYVPVPQYGDKMAFAAETGWGLIVPKNGANVDAAWDYINFFIQEDNLVEHNIACNQLPPRKSMLTNEKYIEAMPNVTFLLDILPDGQWMGPYNTSAMRDIFNNMFIDLCEADKDSRDVEGALTAASEQITKECKMSYSME